MDPTDFEDAGPFEPADWLWGLFIGILGALVAATVIALG